MNQKQRSFDFLDFITVYSLILQMFSVEALAKDATNNDLMKELQSQDRQYLSRIIENQALINEKLDKLLAKCGD